MTLQRRYGWRADKKDFRDVKYAASHRRNLFDIPEKLSLVNESMAPVYDQGDLGSCTANAIAGAYSYLKQFSSLQKIPVEKTLISRLMVYYNEREEEGTVDSDAGAVIRDGIKSLNTIGACLETDWPYIISKFQEKPPPGAYDEAKLHRGLKYQAVNPTSIDVMTALTDGYPVVFGFTVYESFESGEVAQTGIMPIPKTSEREMGGHAVLAVGFDQNTQRLLVRNSWGQFWGMNGYFTMPFACIEMLCSDFWILTEVQ